MILHNVNSFPKDYQYPETLNELSEYDIKELENAGIDEAWYWYCTAPYEGSGWIIFKRGDKWGCESMSHCSCHGPVDNIKCHSMKDTLEDMLACCSEDSQKEMSNLVEAIKGDKK